MEGVILGVDEQKAEAAVKTNDGKRYYFPLSEWKGSFHPQANMKIDFDVQDGGAVAVFPVGTTSGFSSLGGGSISAFNSAEKSKITATLLALFLGGFGGHKFYLGSWGWGIVYLVFCWTYIPAIFAVIEMIRYIVLKDDEFQKKVAQLNSPFSFLW